MRTDLWSKKDLDLLMKLYPVTDASALASIFSRSKDAIRSKATLLGLRKSTGCHGKSRWTEWDDMMMRMLYPDTDVGLICFLLDRSPTAVYGRAGILGIGRSPEYMEKLMAETSAALAKAGEKSRFSAGDGKTGWNKGKKQSDYMAPESIERSKKTRFKKGSIPANHKPVGYERITKDGYVEIKVRDADDSTDNFELKQRLVFERHYGPIPEGMIVEFADGDKLNFSPDNLRLASRKENMIRNTMSDRSIVKKFMGIRDPEIVEKAVREIPEIIGLKRKSLILNRQIDDKR